MLRRFFRRSDDGGRIASALYGVIVAQARAPGLYAVLGVPDTVDGRFEMVVLHLSLLLDRLERGDEGQRAVGQRVFDAFCADMDRSLRELGVGDLSVPKRIKHMVESYYGRAAAYRVPVLAADRTGLVEVLGRNVYSEHLPRLEQVEGLAAYVLAASAELARISVESVVSDGLAFPDPASFLHEDAKS
jgi:cytochrome b pre-mRNA-processing protein 3